MDNVRLDKRRVRRRRRFWRAFGATLIALVLWGILSLSQSYTWDIDVPVVVEIDTTRQALAREIPASLRVTARGNGWALMQIASGNGLLGRLDPTGRMTSANDTVRVFSFSERDLINSIRTPPAVTIEKVIPGSLQLTVTDLTAKRVPLYYPDITVQTRKGFQVIGKPTVAPDSVQLTGSVNALASIDRWYTKPLNLTDIFEPVLRAIPVSDTLRGVVIVRPEIASVSVNVQETAELTFEEVPLVNRSTSSDTTLRLLLYPNRVSVTLRGGTGELSRLDASDILPQIQIIAGIDTSGYARPRISLPRHVNATIIRVEPQRIRYIWRKGVTATSGQ